MYGGEEQEKIYYPVFFIDEEGKTLLKEDNGRFWESVERWAKTRQKHLTRRMGHSTLEIGGLINKRNSYSRQPIQKIK